ncbi:MAG: polyprenyl diphosphate synthase [bacterium]|nr:polyprenyl diphosphate synthase [bacterium]
MFKKLPLTHIAIIPDGNRRWARLHKLPIFKGHQKGAKQFEEILEAADKEGIHYLTMWVASEDNLKKRSKIEVKFLVALFKKYFKKLSKSKKLQERQIRVRIFGKGKEIIKDKALSKTLSELEKTTAKNTGAQLSFLFGYNGTTEMLEAIKKIKKPINEESLRKALWTGELPDIDLVIRTGGEPHNSVGFMMWHSANSESYFSKMLWPDFGAKEFKKAIKEFYSRRRKRGK